MHGGQQRALLIAAARCSGGTGRIDTTIGPRSRPAGRHWRLVVYIATLLPCSMWRIGTPASDSAHSNVKLHPMRNDTRSSRQWSTTSVGSSVSSPCSHTR